MRLDRVTITGADDSIIPNDLLKLSRQYRFVEWGILASASVGPDAGSFRFPSAPWIAELIGVARRVGNISLSLHLCGRWVRELLVGDVHIPELLLAPEFQRIQLNFHAERTPCKAPEFFNAMLSLGKRQYIFQIDGAKGNAHLESLYGENNGDQTVDAVPLFDISGGAGILPTEWPKPQYMDDDTTCCYHGYAGGLGPDNLEQQIPLIGAAAGETPIWIDMETRVRSSDDSRFDLDKVARCLEIAKPHIS